MITAPATGHMPKLITLGSGFLLAVLWVNLMFDVQVWPHWGNKTLPEEVLSSIATYYARVSIEASPMGYLVGLVMLMTLAVSVRNVFVGLQPRWVRIATFVLLIGPVVAALTVIFPGAQKLASRTDTLNVQSELANALFTAHAVCFAAIFLVLILQFTPRRSG